MFKTGYSYSAAICMCTKLFDAFFLRRSIYLSGLAVAVLGIEGKEMLRALWPIEAETGALEGSWKVSKAS